jgi:hypothetical protein
MSTFNDAIRATDEYRRAGFKGVIYLMPQGGVVEPYDKNKLRIADICCAQGWNYSPRLHVDLVGQRLGQMSPIPERIDRPNGHFYIGQNGNCAVLYGPNAVRSQDVDYGPEPWPIVVLLPGPVQEHL